VVWYGFARIDRVPPTYAITTPPHPVGDETFPGPEGFIPEPVNDAMTFRVVAIVVVIAGKPENMQTPCEHGKGLPVMFGTFAVSDVWRSLAGMRPTDSSACSCPKAKTSACIRRKNSTNSPGCSTQDQENRWDEMPRRTVLSRLRLREILLEILCTSKLKPADESGKQRRLCGLARNKSVLHPVFHVNG
jgi:hypothetical protein